MKGDYSQLMPGRYLEQIDLPSAYLVYAVRRRLRRKLQLTLAAHRFASLIQSDAAWQNLAKFSSKIMAITEWIIAKARREVRSE